MELGSDHFKALDGDLVVDIMSRLDGCSLAAMASTCTNLRVAAGDERLWKKVCHNTWPSTSKRQLEFLTGSFKSFYADTFPLILYKVPSGVLNDTPTCSVVDNFTSPQEFISFVDIYYERHCIFSKAEDGLIESMYRTCSDNFQRFLCYPFKLDLLGIGCPKGARDHDFHSFTILPSPAFTHYKEGEDLCDNLVRDLRLSWILFGKRTGKAVNLSSWKPRSIYRSNPSEDGYAICFGCIIPSEDSTLPHPLVECMIMAKCKLMIKQGCIRWKEITLVIKDIDGTHLNGTQSMAVMMSAMICTRSINRQLVEMGYQQFCKQKMEVKQRNEQEESVANIVSATVAIAALLGICYACAMLL